MDGTQILTLGLGLEAPWILKEQHLDTAVSPHPALFTGLRQKRRWRAVSLVESICS
ncbi:hypothetical protein SAMN05878437_1832 [Vreelandella subglaciescola]|uniref:Uncharacterized protein n=1 Tax=Vreelandella subglaciescola TaxID=29571 RepID=A0A1M7H153_9GAMM|nr:hypothetical protein SAMN05878437_1832 [Halomonas subglaciescola]